MPCIRGDCGIDCNQREFGWQAHGALHSKGPSRIPQNISFQNARKYPYFKLKEKAYANEPSVAR